MGAVAVNAIELPLHRLGVQLCRCPFFAMAPGADISPGCLQQGGVLGGMAIMTCDAISDRRWSVLKGIFEKILVADKA